MTLRQVMTPILLVEDDKALRESTAEILVEEGFEVRAAATLEVAKRLLAELAGTKVVILSDLHVSGEDDETVRSWLEETIAQEHVRLIVFSSGTRAAAIAEVLRCRRVSKPFDVELLIDEVKRAATDLA